MSNMEDLEDLVPPEFECAADAYYEDGEEGNICLYADCLASGWGSEVGVYYVGGQWNDSGVDPPAYTIKLEGHYIRLSFDDTYMEYTNKDGIRKNFRLGSSLKLSDFITIIKTPFSLDLSDGNMGKFYQDEFSRKDIVIEVDREHVIKQIHRYVDLLAFS
jgi:hypothetical protein